MGWQVYRSHHDTDLGGGGWGSLSGNEDGEDRRDRQHMGSPSVPLDSWVYSAVERLAGLRAINSQILGVKPWTRMECARLTEEASDTLVDGKTLNNEEATRIQTQLAQEFALRFLRGDFRNADPGKGRFRDFLKRAVYHLMIDHHRARRAQASPLEVVGEPADLETSIADLDAGFARVAGAAKRHVQVAGGEQQPAFQGLDDRLDRRTTSGGRLRPRRTAAGRRGLSQVVRP